MPLSHLMLLSVSTEFRVTPLNEDGITPTSISVRPHSFIGASKVQPVIVNNLGIFAGDRGGHLREAGFSQASAISYLTGDLSLRSTHLFDGLTIEQITYAKAPNPTVWCVSSSGKLLGLTYIPEEAVAAWHQHDTRTGEVFESCAAVAEGMEDRLYVVVQRTINSSTVRYIERMDAQQDAATVADSFFVDAGSTYSGAATTTIGGLLHLANEPVSVLADGLVVSGLTVSAAGVLTLTTAASKVQVGLGYTAHIQTMPMALAIPGLLQGRQKTVDKVSVRVENSGAWSQGPSATKLRKTRQPTTAGTLFTGMETVAIDGNWNIDGQVVLQQTDPLPWSVTAVAYEVALGGM
jgi:hypothetical protein